MLATGVVRGGKIELDEPLAIPVGQAVTVSVEANGMGAGRPSPAVERRAPGPEAAASLPTCEQRPDTGSSLIALFHDAWLNVPADDWRRLPADLSENLDHYLYGAPKNAP